MHVVHSAKQDLLTEIQAAICNGALLLSVDARDPGDRGVQKEGLNDRTSPGTLQGKLGSDQKVRENRGNGYKVL